MEINKIKDILFERSFAGKTVRGGGVKPHPTAKENEEFLNVVAQGLCELAKNVEELKEKTDSLNPIIKFHKFSKNIIQKFNDNPLTFITLIVILAHASIEICIYKRLFTDCT